MGCRCANSNKEEFELSSKKKKEESKEGNVEHQKYELKNNIPKNHIERDENVDYQNQSGQQQIIDNIKDNNIKEYEEEEEIIKNHKKIKYLNYPEKLLEIINAIRADPFSYSNIVEDSIKNIVESINKEDITKNKIVYKKKVKVALTRGAPAFLEVAEELRNTDPLPPLEFVPELCPPLPETEEEAKDSSFLKNQVFAMRSEGIRIDVFFKDMVKIPEISALLMIVDDNGKNSGKKRMTLLNKNIKYIGITCKFVGKIFIAYLTFSK